MNITTLTGRASKDIELRYTPNGKGIASGTIAVQRKFKNAQGAYETDFINFQAWGKTGELMADHIKKGDQFGISGSIQTRNYENSEGKKIYITEVNVNEFDFPNKPKVNFESSENTQAKPSDPNMQDKDPFVGGSIEILDSDLPF